MRGTIHKRIRRYACASPEIIRRELMLSENGLRQEEVHEFRQRYGSNKPSALQQTSPLRCVRRAFVNPFSVILAVIAFISLVTGVLLPESYGRGISNVAIIVVMLLVSGSIRLSQELRARHVAEDLIDMVEITIPVCRDGIWLEVPSEELVVGDLVRLEAGDWVPADIRLISAQDLFVSQSNITGESGTLEKNAEIMLPGPKRVNDYTNTVFQGTTVSGGTAMGIVLAVGTDTVYGLFSTEDVSRKKGFDRGTNTIARVLVKFMVILLPILFVAIGLTKGNWLGAFFFALSVSVLLTPEMLPMVVNACLAKGSFQMGRKQTIVKNINAMQCFGGMDILCVDKTGSLTGDNIDLEYYMDILGNESERVLDLAYLNSCYHTGVHNLLDDAIRRCETMPGRGDHFSELLRDNPMADEQPFDYNRKYVSVLLRGEEENLLVVKGNVQEVVSCCRYVEYKGTITEIGTESSQSVHSIVDEMTEEGMKVLAVAYKKMQEDYLTGEERDFILLGYLAFFDAPKQTAASAIEKLNTLSVDVRLLTGDEKKTTISVCRRIGLPVDNVLTGRELEECTEAELSDAIEQHKIFVELSPHQKALIVEVLQDNGHTVGFLGDGMNDLSAVAQADVGISVDTAADAVKENADVILLKKDLNVLSEGVLEGRKAFANMSKYVKITAASNFGNICAIIVAALFLPFFPLTSMQLLLLDLLYDVLCLVLPWDNVDTDMFRRPREWSGQSLGRFMTFFGPVCSAFGILTFVFLFFFLCPRLCGGTFAALDSTTRAQFISLFQTGWFLESMWTQILLLHLLRTKHTPLIQSRASRIVLLVTALGLFLFTALTFTGVGTMLGLTALPLSYFLFLLLTVALFLLAVSGMKKLYLRQHRDLL